MFATNCLPSSKLMVPTLELESRTKMTWLHSDASHFRQYDNIMQYIPWATTARDPPKHGMSNSNFNRGSSYLVAQAITPAAINAASLRLHSCTGRVGNARGDSPGCLQRQYSCVVQVFFVRCHGIARQSNRESVPWPRNCPVCRLATCP